MKLLNRLIFIIGVACLLTTGAFAQLETVRLQVDSTGIGVGGYYQPGSWTAMLLTLENPSPQPRKVICEWSVPDADGDMVQHRRWVTLGPGPGNVQQAWLYAMLPVGISPQASAQVRVMEAGTDETLTTTQARVLAQVTVPLPKRLAMEQRPIGIVGSSAGMMGLRPYETLPTQHEALLLIGGLEPSQLPDRWYGLAMLQTLIWTPSAGDPGAMEVSEASRQALREWVKRGGHLVVILPSEGDAWPRSPLRDILPIESDQIRKIEDLRAWQLPTWLGQPIRESEDRFVAKWFDLPAGSKSTRVLSDGSGRPWVVGGPHGLGRVTVIGVDVTDRRLAAYSLPNPFTQNHNPVGVLLWPTVLGLRGPVYTDAYLTAERLDQPPPNMRYRWVDLAWFVPGLIAMRETAAPALLAAIVVFGVYWLAAGPGGYAWLKRKGKLRHAWVVFAGIVILFTLVTWTGAFFLRPQQERIAHFSVVDMDNVTGWVHKQSWLALYVPEHGKIELELPQADDQSGGFPSGGNNRPGLSGTQGGAKLSNTLAAPGLLAGGDAGGFIDPQRYVMDASSPNQAMVPMRSTAKLVELNVLEPLQKTGPQGSWTAPTGRVKFGPAGLIGELTHQLPGALRDVLLVYVPGKTQGMQQHQEALVWRHREPWLPGQVLKIEGVKGQPMVIEPVAPNDKERDELRQWRGHLGDLLRTRGPEEQENGEEVTLADDRLVQRMELLSFYGLLPTPDFRAQSYPLPLALSRSMGRSLDLTPRLGLKGLWLIGHLDNRKTKDDESGLQLPLKVNGENVKAGGWTMVRMFVEVE